VNRQVDRLSRLALAAVMMAALGLAACGRKGPLEPPPAAGLTNPQPTAARPSLGEENDSLTASQPGERAPARPQSSAPASASPPAKKSFFLDFLIGK
jgi:predicted small lipoprotein YifL